MSKRSARTKAWRVSDDDFYELESRDEQLEFLLQYAILAPSGHNTQPWGFKTTDEGIEVYADSSRAMPVVDPGDRELLMSVGAALTNLRVAAAHFGFSPCVVYQHLHLSAGNLRFRPLGAIYRASDLFVALRDTANLKGKCGRCEFRQLCGGSRARAWAMEGNLFADDPLCAYEPGAAMPLATARMREA